jgi:hypothetical protein
MKFGQFINQNQTLVQTVGGGIQSIVQGVFVPPKADDSDILKQ